MPAVERATAANILPASGWNPDARITVEGQDVPDPAQQPRTGFRAVAPGFFEAMGIPMAAGRTFGGGDDERGQPVAIVSASTAERFWPGQDPIGRRLRVEHGSDGGAWLTVVGVAGDVTMYNWWDGVDRSAVYVPARQAPPSGMVFLAVRARGEPARLAAPIRDALAGVDPLLRAQQVRTIRDAIDENSRSLTWIAWLMGVCGALGALLALVGIYSLMAYTVSQREHEFGVRMALGATSADVLRMTLAQAGRLAAAGIAAGLALAWLFGRALAGLMTDLFVLEPSIFLVVPPALALVALAAAYVPARRALRVEPATVLRQ